MAVVEVIQDIRSRISTGQFPSEASVAQGIVMRLLASLGWPQFDTEVVWPEYSLEGRRVDFALCNPPKRPIAFIEVKQIGQSDGAERQLFEYAFHEGIPLAILTDGREWSFFLPGEQGDYGERRVYKLNIVDRDVQECADRLERYLLHSAVISGAAIQSAREDYRNVSKDRQMQAALPKAWQQLVADKDEMLLEVIADRVESLCGFKPEPDMVAAFLNALGTVTVPSPPIRPAVQTRQNVAPVSSTTAKASVQARKPRASARSMPDAEMGVQFMGQFYPARNAKDILRQVFHLLIQRDNTFAKRFADLPKHGHTRRYLARNANDLYSNRPDLVREHSIQLDSGWWLGTNHNKKAIEKIIKMACQVAGIKPGRDFGVHF